MTTNDSATTCWAIIIGINYYPSDRCLQGSVRDAKMVQHYLEKRAAPVDIIILTATTPSTTDPGRPVEKAESWPTHANVISGIKRVLEMARPGDLVYFHYSGHGTHTPGDAQPGSHSSGELALVLFEHNKVGSSYFRGRHLANALRKMVDKGLVVTLVLDCCFSGSVVRHDDWQGFDIRFLSYEPDIDAASPQENETSLLDLGSTLRDSQLERDWLVNPNGYTILTACGPHESAFEIEVDGQGRRGALTYFLLNTLSTLGNDCAEFTQQSLHRHLCSKFHASWPQQTPMRYGNTSLSIFGNLISQPEAFPFSIFRTNDRLCIQAGQAQGICKGDEFAACPLNVSELASNQTNEISRILKAETVRPFDCDLVEVGEISSASPLTTDWRAKLITCVSPRRIRVRLAANIDNKAQWLAAAKGRRFLQLLAEDEGEPCIFNVTVNENEEYEVVDVLQKKVGGFPTATVNSFGTIDAMLSTLQHLATFKYFEGLENRLPNMTFQRSFSLTPYSAVGAPGTFIIKHSGIWGFTIENTRDKPLYLAMFNFSPSWEIVNMVSHSGGDDYLVVPPKGKANGKKDIKLRMEVPEVLQRHGQDECEDIVKVFITTKPISFPSMILPQISLNTDPSRERASTSGFSNLILELAEAFRGQDSSMEEEWSTQNFIIRTTLE